MGNELEYYTPNIEDIRVGYACEINEIGSSCEWIPRIIEVKDLYENITIDLANGYIRTPYLTVEQIEAEGWIVESHILGYYAQKDGWVLLYDNVDKVAEISEEDGTIVCFSGSCPSINEFKIISKWLKI